MKVKLNKDNILINIASKKDCIKKSKKIEKFGNYKGINIHSYKTKNGLNRIVNFQFDKEYWDVDKAQRWINAIDENPDEGWEKIYDINDAPYRDEMDVKYYGTIEALDTIVSNYDIEYREAPLLVDHSEVNFLNPSSKAYGWVKELKRVGTGLYAKLYDITEEGKKFINDKVYKYKSVGFIVIEEMGGYLFELSLTNIPAVPSLKPMKSYKYNCNFQDIEVRRFSSLHHSSVVEDEDDDNSENKINDKKGINMDEIKELNKKIEALNLSLKEKDDEINLMKDELSTFKKNERVSNLHLKLEKLYSEKKINPKILNTLGDTPEKLALHLSEVFKEDSQVDLILSIIEAVGNNDLTNQLTSSVNEDEALDEEKKALDNKMFSSSQGYASLDIEVKNYMKANNMDDKDYKKALDIVLNKNKAGGK